MNPEPEGPLYKVDCTVAPVRIPHVAGRARLDYLLEHPTPEHLTLLRQSIREPSVSLSDDPIKGTTELGCYLGSKLAELRLRPEILPLLCEALTSPSWPVVSGVLQELALNDRSGILRGSAPILEADVFAPLRIALAEYSVNHQNYFDKRTLARSGYWIDRSRFIPLALLEHCSCDGVESVALNHLSRRPSNAIETGLALELLIVRGNHHALSAKSLETLISLYPKLLMSEDTIDRVTAALDRGLSRAPEPRAIRMSDPLIDALVSLIPETGHLPIRQRALDILALLRHCKTPRVEHILRQQLKCGDIGTQALARFTLTSASDENVEFYRDAIRTDCSFDIRAKAMDMLGRPLAPLVEEKTVPLLANIAHTEWNRPGVSDEKRILMEVWGRRFSTEPVGGIFTQTLIDNLRSTDSAKFTFAISCLDFFRREERAQPLALYGSISNLAAICHGLKRLEKAEDEHKVKDGNRRAELCREYFLNCGLSLYSIPPEVGHALNREVQV